MTKQEQGHELKARRIMAGITIQELASMIGYSYYVIEQIEEERSRVHPYILRLMDDALTICEAIESVETTGWILTHERAKKNIEAEGQQKWLQKSKTT